MKTNSNKKLNLSAFVSSIFEKLKRKSGLTILLLLSQQSLFAQTTATEANSDAYSNFIIVIVLLLIASIFIGLEIIDDPKDESKVNINFNNSAIIAGSPRFPVYQLDKKIASKLKIVFYIAGILVLMYAVLIILML